MLRMHFFLDLFTRRKREACLSVYYLPQRKVREGNVFKPVCHSVRGGAFVAKIFIRGKGGDVHGKRGRLKLKYVFKRFLVVVVSA